MAPARFLYTGAQIAGVTQTTGNKVQSRYQTMDKESCNPSAFIAKQAQVLDEAVNKRIYSSDSASSPFPRYNERRRERICS
jgi:hypothetical protein